MVSKEYSIEELELGEENNSVSTFLISSDCVSIYSNALHLFIRTKLPHSQLSPKVQNFQIQLQNQAQQAISRF